jgi:hypothetical protein
MAPGDWDVLGALPIGVAMQSFDLNPPETHVFPEEGRTWTAVQLRSPSTASESPDGGPPAAAVILDYLELNARFCSLADGGACP